MATATPIPVIPAGKQTYFGRFLAWFKGEVSTGWRAVTDFMEHDALPFLETFLKQTALDEIAALKPLAEEAAAAIVTDIPQLFSEPGKFLGSVTAIADSTMQKAEATGLSVAESSVQTASLAALHNLIAANTPAS
jgi:hypothetical protein